MNRLHALALAVLLGLAAVAGSYAALGTTALGASAGETTVSDAQIAAREAKLDKAERALRRAAKRRPPALPHLPARRSSSTLAAASAPAQPAPGPAAYGDDDHDSDDDWDDDRDEDRHDRDDDHSGHGHGGEDDHD